MIKHHAGRYIPMAFAAVAVVSFVGSGVMSYGAVWIGGYAAGVTSVGLVLLGLAGVKWYIMPETTEDVIDRIVNRKYMHFSLLQYKDSILVVGFRDQDLAIDFLQNVEGTHYLSTVDVEGSFIEELVEDYADKA